MSLYEDKALKELFKWKEDMESKASAVNDFTKNIQEKMNSFILEIGAVVGAYANYKLMEKLENTAVNAYRLRIFKLDI
ncbi:EcsC family protein [Clostridium sp. JNZ X4-2]